MTSLNNLEKLIQMATIEHMYTMLHKMKTDPVFNSNDNNISAVDISLNSPDISTLENVNKGLQITINTLINRISILENEIKDLKNNTENSNIKNEYLCAQLRGQQKLTSYPGFSKQDQTVTRMDTEPNVILKIEEKNMDIDNNVFTETLEQELLNHDITINLAEEESEDEEEEESEDEEKDEEKEESEDEDDDESEDESEEEVKTDEEVEETKEVEAKSEVEVESEEEVEAESEEEVEETKVEEEEEEEEQEEEEEVFEIEIDDITYFATDEENGILYAMTKDGDVGEKVGIIKEGEPIFS